MIQRRKSEIVQVNLRLREDFRQRLAAAADKSGYSFNQELVRRLEESFDKEDERERALKIATQAVYLATSGAVPTGEPKGPPKAGDIVFKSEPKK